MSSKQNIHDWLFANVIGQPPTYVSAALLRQRGATSIEYALLSALIALVVLGSISSTGSAVFDLWANIAARVEAAIG